jgi:ATP-dependent DNA ligase
MVVVRCRAGSALGAPGQVGIARSWSLPLGFIPPCLPMPCHKAPSGSAWVHEIKHDGYRLIAQSDGNRVRLYTRRGYDWARKYPWIVDSLLSLRVRSITVDGEAVRCGKDGKSDFDRLPRMRMTIRSSSMPSTRSN